MRRSERRHRVAVAIASPRGRRRCARIVRRKGETIRYKEYQAAIQNELIRYPDGLTWAQLKNQLDLPYERPCPTWTACLEREIGLVRVKNGARALVWKLSPVSSDVS